MGVRRTGRRFADDTIEVVADEFGTVGDGVADDSGAIQRAIDSLAAGGTVYLPSGIYSVAGLVVSGDRVRIVGEGESTILRRRTAGVILRILGDDCTLEGLRFEANALSGWALRINVDGAAVEQRARFRAHHLQIYGDHVSAGGIYCGWHSGVDIARCELENTAPTASDVLTQGIVLHSGDDQTSDDARIVGNRVRGYFRGIESYGTGLRARLLIEANTVRECADTGIYGYHGSGSRIVDNCVEDCGAGGIWADSGVTAGSTPYANTVRGNQVRRCVTYGLLTEEIQAGAIDGNTLTENGDGMVLGGGTGATTVSGNVCAFNARYGVWVERAQSPVTDYAWDLTFVGNVVKGNGQDGMRFGGVRRTLTLIGNSVCDNGTSAADIGSSTYAGIWIGKDAGTTASRGALIVGNTIGNGFLAVSGDGPTGKQGYGVILDDTSIARAVLVANHMDGHGSFDVLSTYNAVHLIANNLTKGVSLPNATVYGYANTGAGPGFGQIAARSAAPTSGTWKVGDVVFHTAPAAAGFIGWVCTAAGTPGTWKTWGAISA